MRTYFGDTFLRLLHPLAPAAIRHKTSNIYLLDASIGLGEEGNGLGLRELLGGVNYLRILRVYNVLQSGLLGRTSLNSSD